MFPAGLTSPPSSTKRIPGRTVVSAFFAANAGIADNEALLQPFDLDADPVKSNLSCIEVDLLAVFYGLKLFIHFMRKARRDLAKPPTVVLKTRSHSEAITGQGK
jgi:hypothetical protein